MQLTIYTIGHSNHELDVFVRLLREQYIEILVDVRSMPYSKHAQQFNKEIIESFLERSSIKYLFLGDSLGGRPKDESCYNKLGEPVYETISEKDFFKQGIERLIRGIEKFRVCIMCSEENPSICHRHNLISKYLDKRNVDVYHIRADKSVISFKELEKQPDLFF